MAVGIGDSLLIVEIRHVPYTPDDVAYPEGTADVDGKAFIMGDPHSFHALGGLADDVLALLHGKETSLCLVDTDGYDDFIEYRQRPGEDVQVT